MNAVRTLGRYELTRIIGHGAHAEVYEAIKTGVGGWQKRYAVKALLPAYADLDSHRKLFLREASTLVKITHPNIVDVHDCFEEKGRIFLVEDFVDGVSLVELSEQLDDQEEITAIVSALLLQGSEAISYLHSPEINVLHRDLSPSNLLIDRDGRLVIVDFGLVQNVNEKLETSRNYLVGKPAFLAPEVKSDFLYSPASDIFAFGKILYRLSQKGEGAIPRWLRYIINEMIHDNQEERIRDGNELWCRLSTIEQLDDYVRRGYGYLKNRVEILVGQRGDKEKLDSSVTIRLKRKESGSVKAATVLVVSGLISIILSSMPRSLNRLELESSKKMRMPGLTKVEIDSVPWAYVYVNGKFEGLTPLRTNMIKANKYRVDLFSAEGKRETVMVDAMDSSYQQVFRKLE